MTDETADSLPWSDGKTEVRRQKSEESNRSRMVAALLCGFFGGKFAADVIYGCAEHPGQLIKRNTHVAGKRRFDRLPDVRIDFKMLRLGVGQADAGFV